MVVGTAVIGSVRAALFAAAILLAVSALIAIRSNAGVSSSPGCGDVPRIIDEAVPDPVERQRGPGHAPAILDRPARQLATLAEIPEQLQVQFPTELSPSLGIKLILLDEVQRDATGTVRVGVELFYGSRPPADREGYAAYIDAGGMIVRQGETTGMNADAVLAELKSQGRTPLPPTVMVGPHPAVAIHSDPIVRNDLRPWHLYWSDGTYDYSIIADMDPQEILTIARSIHCDA